MDQMSKMTQDEQMVLDLIRSRKFQNITIQINDGKIVLIRREETIKLDHTGNHKKPIR